nr:EOG090X0DHL [Cyclestheria hislopi]
MFVLSLFKQTVRVSPHCFKKNLDEAIGEELNKKFANKVVLNVGLCIALWDITKREESYILPGDGGSHTKVHFRFVVFRPFLEQILVGKIKNCNPDSVQISLGFFDDIIIPAENLQHPSRFDEAEHLWVWEYQTDEGKHDLFMDTGEEIRFRVVSETFNDTTPAGPNMESKEAISDAKENKRIPYLITATISEPGLGLLSWWSS